MNDTTATTAPRCSAEFHQELAAYRRAFDHIWREGPKGLPALDLSMPGRTALELEHTHRHVQSQVWSADGRAVRWIAFSRSGADRMTVNSYHRVAAAWVRLLEAATADALGLPLPPLVREIADRLIRDLAPDFR